MKLSIIRKGYFSFLLLAFSLTTLFLISCSDEGQENHSKAAPPESAPEYEEEAAAVAEGKCGGGKAKTEYAEEAEPNGGSKSKSSKSNKLDEYTVVLGVDEQMKIPGLPGELRVWIGSPSFKPNFPTRMTQDKTNVPAEGESARVEPFAPAFEIDPTESQCVKIHPTGSEVRFKLIPRRQGTFEVGANVYLFDSFDCSGSPIPKTAATLKVTVEVNQKEIFAEKAKELWNILWEKFLGFWAAFVALVFGLILFLIRGKLKKWFGYEDE